MLLSTYSTLLVPQVSLQFSLPNVLAQNRVCKHWSEIEYANDADFDFLEIDNAKFYFFAIHYDYAIIKFHTAPSHLGRKPVKFSDNTKIYFFSTLKQT